MNLRRSALLSSEDWWSVWIGIGIFALSLLMFAGVDALGWAVQTREWLRPGDGLGPVSKGYATLPGALSALLTYLFLLLIMGVGAAFLEANLKKFALGFTVIFWASFACWFLGHYAYIAATRTSWAARNHLVDEPHRRGGLIIALRGGTGGRQLLPGKGPPASGGDSPRVVYQDRHRDHGRRPWRQGGGRHSASPRAVIFRGFCAIVEAYLIYWALVYFVARKYFGFSREWAAPLASGISICGVSAAIATGGGDSCPADRPRSWCARW